MNKDKRTHWGDVVLTVRISKRSQDTTPVLRIFPPSISLPQHHLPDLQPVYTMTATTTTNATTNPTTIVTTTTTTATTTTNHNNNNTATTTTVTAATILYSKRSGTL